MNKFLQISCYAISFVFLLWIGNVYAWVITTEPVTTDEIIPGKPLPAILKFFAQNHFVVPYLFVFPWLGFSGLPFFFLARASYWDADFFLLRFSVFLPTVTLILFFFSYCCILPFFYVWQSLGDPVPFTWIELSVQALFWLSVLLIIIAFFVRMTRGHGVSQYSRGQIERPLAVDSPTLPLD